MRWHRQHSLDSNYSDMRNSFKNNRNTRMRKSSGDISSRDAAIRQPSLSGAQETQQLDGIGKGFPFQGKFATVEEAAKSESSASSEKSESDAEDITGVEVSAGDGGDNVDDDEDEDEDWDVEFGFAENSEDEQMELSTNIGSTGGMDSNRRRSDNFNIFLRNFHDMMDGDDLSEDDDDFQTAPKSKRQSKPAEEQLFQRKRSEYQRHLSIDGSVDGAGRASLTSVSGSVEYTLADKYRVLEVASSSAYAVRIERYPKPCTTYSSLEKDVGFASFSENKFERWLETFVSSKCDLAFQVMEKEREQMTNPRQQKNHQFRTLVSLPFGKEFVANFFKQVSLYRYFGEEKSNRELVRVFFEKVSTTAYSEEDWSLPLITEDFGYIANCTMEILQEAARMYGPKPPASNWNSSSFSFSSTSSSQNQASSSATLFWMRQFQSILLICAEAFPKYRHVIALIELRYVSHHLIGFASGDFTYTWQICNQLPAFCPMEMIAGESAPNVANEILEYYGALFVHLNTSPESRNSWQGESPPLESATEAISELKSISFGISPDVICLQALVLCDIQCLYESRSVLAEVSIPELVELFEFEDDDMNIDPRLMELLDTEVKVQASVPGLYTGARNEETPRKPERRNSSGGLGGWSTEARLLSLLKPSSSSRISALGFFYDRISTVVHPLVKAKCASVLGSMHILAGSLSNLRAAESLAYEAVRLLEACSSKKLEPFTTGVVATAEALCLSMFNNDGLLSELGREAMEQLGNVLIKNQKYRYGILVLEAAGLLFGFLNQGCEYEKMDRLLCRLTLEADDVQRALPLHEKVANSTQRQGNITEFVYLTQALTNLWIREGKFARAEENLLSAFRFLRDHTNVLPQSFLSCLYGSYSSSDAATSSRSGTMMTATSSTASSSISGSFHVSSRGSGNTSELDTWLNHDINLHLLVREIYRSSGRCLEGMQVLQHLLSYSTRLPRGKRTHVRMLLAEDALKMNMLDTCRYMFGLLDQEANLFCERLKENILSSTIGSSSGGGGGSSSGGGRSMGGLGSEARYCFDMVFSIRYVTNRAKYYLKSEDYREAFAWLSLAHIKSDKENLQKQAQLHFLDGKALFGLFREFYESRRSEKAPPLAHPASLAAEVKRMITSFAGSFYGLTTNEKGVLEKRLTLFCECVGSAETAMEHGVKSFWTAFDQYQSLDDSLHQLKALLEIVNFSLAPVEQSFFTLGSNLDDDMLKSYLYRGSAFKKNGAANPLHLDENAPDDDIIEKTRRSVSEAQKLLRKAMNLAEQVAEPACLLRTFILCSEAWIWLERIASYKNDKMVKEAAAFWEEGVKLLKAVYLRRVAFHNTEDAARYRSMGLHGVLPAGHADGGANGTFCVVPILNFSESVILKLDNMTLQLIFIACQLQQFERVPEYVEEMIGVHLDELLSAKMCLSSIAQQLSAFREHQRLSKRGSQSSMTSAGSTPTSATPRGSATVVSSDATTRAASFTLSSSTPALHSNTGSVPSSTSSTVKRKGHKKNQSMSSISELLASGGSSAPSTSFHDISSSFSGSTRGGSFLGSSTTPRTGLASLNDRGTAPHGKHQSGAGIHPPLIIRTHRGHHGFDRTVLRTRGRSRSAPQPIVPDTPSKLESSEASHGGEPHELLTPVNESRVGEKARRIVDLADVSSWSHEVFGATGDDHGSYGLHGEGSSSGGAIGLYDFDEVQSEKLWWIFNMWRDAKVKYTSGKIESSGFRTQNLRYLRTLLDTFDPHQVAVLYVNGSGSSSTIPSGSTGGKVSNTSNACGIVGFDVAHINSYALIKDNSLVLSIGYDLDKGTQIGYSQLKFKVFCIKEGETLCWRSEIPRPDWFLKHFDLVEAESAAAGAGALRTLRLLGPKLLVKLLGLLLLENSLVIIGSSFSQVQEVCLSLLKLLQPFHWQHTFLPFIPVSSWRYLYDSLQMFSQAQQAARPKSRKSFSRLSTEWRWGGSSASSASSLPNMVEAVDGDEPPFLFGTTTETWHSCMMYARSRGDDTSRTIASYVTVVDLDCLETFAIAKSSTNAVTLPRKWRKHFLERFDKVAKHRRKAQQKVSRRLARQSHVPSTPGGMSTASTPHGVQSPQHSEDAYRYLDMTHRSFDDVHSSRSATMWLSQGEVGPGSGGQILVPSVALADAGGAEERLFYDSECFAAFISGLHEFYDKLCSLCEEKDKKLKGSKKKGGGLSKRQELKAWFSSSHEFDPFVDKFQESEMYLQYEKEKAQQFTAAAAAAGAALSRRSTGVSSSSEASGVTSSRGPLFALLSTGSSGSGSISQATTLGPRSSQQLKRAGSMSSTSSGGVGMGF